MSIRFNVNERPNPRDLQAPKKFYPNAVSSGEINLKQISKRIAQMCTVNSADVLAVLDSLVQAMQDELGNGNIVRLGDFGTFSVGLSGSGEAKKEDVTAANVKNARIHFRPGIDLKNTLAIAHFEKAG